MALLLKIGWLDGNDSGLLGCAVASRRTGAEQGADLPFVFELVLWAGGIESAWMSVGIVPIAKSRMCAQRK